VDAAPEWNPSSPAAVDLGTQLDAVLAFLRQYVVLTVDQAVAVTLWIAHTHAFDAAECTPYLQITSATRRTGKTRLLEISEPLVARPWLTGRVSAAALVRRIDEEQSTLLLDESDAAFKGEKDYAEALRGILNSGYRRSGRSTLCVGQGSNIRTRDFRTFSPKAIAGIGALPGTIADRAIPIALKRRTTQEPCARYREREVRQLARPMQDVLSAWAASAIEGLRAARPALPDCINDRAADCWEPLLAIAELAGHHWPAAAMRAAVALSGDAEDGDGDLVVDLLHDIRTVFEDLQSSFIASSLLVTKLAERDDRPWATWGKQGKGISGHAVARLLKPFGIVPLQSPDRKSRGYYEDRFADAWARYPTNEVSNRPEPNKDGLQSTISDCPTASAADTSKTQSTPIDTGVSDTWTLQSAKKRHDGGKV
jgi:hypothetical protein